MRDLHARKSADYAQDDNPFSNFETAAALANQFTHPIDRVFATLIGVKLARLAQLTQESHGEPLHESILDTRIDLANYAAIWTSWYLAH